MVLTDWVALAVPERGDELLRTLLGYYWQFTLNDRVISSDTCHEVKDWLLGGAKSMRSIPEKRMVNAILWFRDLYGELDG